MRQKISRKPPDTSRSVVVDGVRYRSILEAAKAHNCSTTKIYYMIGERWRAK